MDTEGVDATASKTIALLETRLRRLEFYTTGTDGSQEPTEDLPSQETETKQENVQARLQRIEAGLQQLAAHSQVVRDILKLCKILT